MSTVQIILCTFTCEFILKQQDISSEHKPSQFIMTLGPIINLKDITLHNINAKSKKGQQVWLAVFCLSVE